MLTFVNILGYFTFVNILGILEGACLFSFPANAYCADTESIKRKKDSFPKMLKH